MIRPPVVDYLKQNISTFHFFGIDRKQNTFFSFINLEQNIMAQSISKSDYRHREDELCRTGYCCKGTEKIRVGIEPSSPDKEISGFSQREAHNLA